MFAALSLDSISISHSLFLSLSMSIYMHVHGIFMIYELGREVEKRRDKQQRIQI